jgi:hypothetical protein
MAPWLEYLESKHYTHACSILDSIVNRMQHKRDINRQEGEYRCNDPHMKLPKVQSRELLHLWQLVGGERDNT